MLRPRILLALAAALAAAAAPVPAQQNWQNWLIQDGSESGALLGYQVVQVGDLDGDGATDLAVSLPHADGGGLDAGAVLLISGADGSLLATLDGPAAGAQLGLSLALLGEHGDGLTKIAVGMPYATSSGGFLAGLVQVWAWDPVSSTVALWDELEGAVPGDLMGWDLAATDWDADGDLDLVVATLGANFSDGRVEVWTVGAGGLAAFPTLLLDGAPASGEGLGFALATGAATGGGAGLGQPDLLMGAPFADSDLGRAYLLESGGNLTLLTGAAPAPGAHLGYAVAAGRDVDNDGIPDLLAGAPDADEGTVTVWSGASRMVLDQLVGEAAGDRFGAALALLPDGSFDGAADVAVGAPGALSSDGKAYVWAMLPTPFQLLRVSGTSGSASQLGWSVADAGDANLDGKPEVAFGAPWAGSQDEGRIQVWSAPPVDLGPLELTIVSGSFVWETDVTLEVDNLNPNGGDLYWYAGTAVGASTSPEGYLLDVAGNVTLFDTSSHLGVGPISATYTVPPFLPANQLLAFQVVEDQLGFVRNSDVETGNAVDPGLVLEASLNTAARQLTLQTKYGLPNSPVYFYYTLRGVSRDAVHRAPNGSWKLNLKAPKLVPQSIFSDAQGVAVTAPIDLPPVVHGRTAWFQAYDWDIFEPALSNVAQMTFP